MVNKVEISTVSSEASLQKGLQEQFVLPKQNFEVIS